MDGVQKTEVWSAVLNPAAEGGKVAVMLDFLLSLGKLGHIVSPIWDFMFTSFRLPRMS